ncbi:LPS assembly lipoprotein LptE [Ascidiaceihabitans sp.]|nr:LPS assembly lipoprotein LptE [Ascidiaceihabitans sp.]
MSLFKYLLILPFLAFTACGFTPVYGTNGNASVLLDSVLVQEPKNREGYSLTKQIEKRLGRATDPRFKLGVTVTTSEAALNVDSTGNINRYNVLGLVEYTLRDTQTGQIAASGRVDSFTGYSASGTTVSAQAAKEDAQERLMIILADLLISNLIATSELPS